MLSLRQMARPQPPPWLGAILPAASLAILTLAAYYPAMRAGYVWDDTDHFLADELIADPDGLYAIWFAPGKSPWNYWPLTRTSFWIERQAWGFNAFLSHLINIFLHLASVLILYAGLRRFRVEGAWLIAGLFAVHPVFVESVAWVTERKNVLSGVFYLLAIWTYLHFDEKRRWPSYACALFLFAAALLAKSSTVMLPVVIVFARLALRREWSQWDCLRLAPFFLLSLAAAWANIWFEEHMVGAPGSRSDTDWAAKVAIAARIPFFYLGKILFPWPLAVIYPKWQIDGGRLLDYLPLLGGIALALACWRFYGTWGRPLFLALGAFAASLFPVLGLFHIDGMHHTFVADRWVYLAALPVLVLLGAGAVRLRTDAWPLKPVAGAAVLGACGVLTWNYSGVFHDKETLWRDTVRKNPSSWTAHYNLGNILHERGQRDEALIHLSEALRLVPDSYPTHNNLGNVLRAQGRIDEAIHHFSESLRIKPDHSPAHNNLGEALMAQGRIDEAIAHFEEARRLRPESAHAHYCLGSAAMNRDKPDEAIAHFRAALRAEPGHVNARNNLGAVLYLQGELDEAVAHFREALRLDPGNEDVTKNLEEALRRRREGQ